MKNDVSLALLLDSAARSCLEPLAAKNESNRNYINNIECIVVMSFAELKRVESGMCRSMGAVGSLVPSIFPNLQWQIAEWNAISFTNYLYDLTF